MQLRHSWLALHTPLAQRSASSQPGVHGWSLLQSMQAPSASQTPLGQAAHEPASGVSSAVFASRPWLLASPAKSEDPSRSSSPASRHAARLAAHASLDEDWDWVEASSPLEVFEVHPAIEPSPQTKSARLVPCVFRTVERASVREPFHKEVIDMSDTGSNKRAA